MKVHATLAHEVRCSGIAVHSGKITHLVIKPAPFEYGIQFLVSGCSLMAHWQQVGSTRSMTTLTAQQKNTHLGMVEHFLAACYGIGLTDLCIEVDGEECPIFDGSSEPYVNLLQQGGRKESTLETQWIVMQESLSLVKEQQRIEVSPGLPSFSVSMPLSKDIVHHYSYSVLEGNFIEEIAPSRTFVKLEDIQNLRNSGFIQGGSLSCAVVLKDGIPINTEGFRLDQECARHKILDLIGDFALLGKFFYGQVSAVFPGHSLNHAMLKAIMHNPHAFQVLPFHQLPLG
jgi:UDP-3-O-[3-hydroxymyristoyl] N-acetylglucosamine deacetylase